MVWPLKSLYNALVTYIGASFSSQAKDASAKHKELITELGAIRANQEKEMNDITQVQGDETKELAAIEDLKTTATQALTNIQTNNQLVADQSKVIQALKDQIAAGQPVTAEQLDNLDADIVSGTSSVKQLTAALAAAIAPAPPAAPSTATADNPPA